MKKVLFKKWIPIQYVDNDKGGKNRAEGTGCWEQEFKNEGFFHQWANACQDSESGFGNYTVALVQVSDGTIQEVLPHNIKFLPEN